MIRTLALSISFLLTASAVAAQSPGPPVVKMKRLSAPAAKIAVLASFFGALLFVTGSLWIQIVLHFVVDAVGVLLGPRLLAKEVER